jgi:hypothetical protein
MTRSRRIWLILIGAVVLAPFVGWAGYAAVTWLRYGHARPASATDPVADRFMAVYDIREVHETRVRAPASITYHAVTELDVQKAGINQAIFRGREILLRSAAPPRPSNYPLICELVAIGWGILKEIPGREIVFGAVTQPWEANVVFRGLRPSEFAAFDSAGYVKILVTLVVDSVGPNESIFRTETRVQTTDPVARARFRRYWSIFSPGILLIRQQILQLVRREAAAEYRNTLREPSGGPNSRLH